MIPKNFLPLSASSLGTFLQCPAKLWYARNWDLKPLKIPSNKYAKIGLIFHKIIASYYKQLLKRESFLETDISENLQKAVAVNEKDIDDLKDYTYNLKSFEEFEQGRFKWSEVKPISVEQKYKKDIYTGYIDVIYKGLNGETIPVDWKTGKFKEDFYIQGWIYKYIACGDKILLFFPVRRRTIELSEENLIDGKRRIDGIIKEIEKGVNEKRPNPYCSECEYSLPCHISRLDVKLEDL